MRQILGSHVYVSNSGEPRVYVSNSRDPRVYVSNSGEPRVQRAKSLSEGIYYGKY